MRTSLAFVALLLFSAGCGGGPSSGTDSIINPPPVQAASGFTNASLNGSYAFGSSGVCNNSPCAGTGVVTADGNGNLIAGEETANIGGILCHGTFTGTYSVNSNGTGTATTALTVDSPSAGRGCVGSTSQLSLAIASGGNNLVLSGQNASSVVVYTAVKQ